MLGDARILAPPTALLAHRMREPTPALPPPPRVDLFLHEIGDWLMRNQRAIAAVQWSVVGLYLLLLIVPVLAPLPEPGARIWNDVVLFAQFVLWGLWWPLVLLSMVLVGRAWCGLLCPEGTITEAVSSRSRGRGIPLWMRWSGWPFLVFAVTTIYGQMISVYHYPSSALLILGASTSAAIVTGLLWGRNKRVWCRFLCPVNGVFGVLAKLAPLHFRVDNAAWDRWNKPRGATPVVNCAPLVPMRTMKGASACHMCGRCSSYRDAITLARRSPNREIVEIAGAEPKPVETVLILFGLLGIAAAAFHWPDSELYLWGKLQLGGWLLRHDWLWPLQGAPWWLLTHHPERGDVMTLLDGAVLLGYIVVVAAAIGGFAALCLASASRCIGRWSTRRFHHLVQALIPLAACGVWLGLSRMTVWLLHDNGLAIAGLMPLRAALLGGALLWSLWLGWRIIGRYSQRRWRRLAAMVPFTAAVAMSGAVWARLFWSF